MHESPTVEEDRSHAQPAVVTTPRRDGRDEAYEVHPSGLAIIASKIGPAAPGRAVLHRPRLLDWLIGQGRARVVLVSAEAGYGKTTLLNEFAMQTRDTCVWYRMESSDGDWITFLSYMVAAFRDVWPGFGRSTEALLRNVAAMGSTREVVLAQFLAELGAVEDRRVSVILDDYHLVEKSTDIRMILSRMLELAPEGMCFILGGRGAPNLSLGRLTAQGRVSELTIDDLRFTLQEIEQLFSSTFGQPLDTATCRIIAERTDGWAASLQLVSASIASSQPGEVAGFIRALSGATGPIYDFLAEEVLTRLDEQTARILMHASLVVSIRPAYVAAALKANDRAADVDAVERVLGEAEALGLLGSRTTGPDGHRMHPLFREFLAVHLEQQASPERMAAMHGAIARQAEAHDWLVAAKHFARAGEAGEAMRVLGSAASEALGTGAWGSAIEIIDLLPETAPPPAVQVIQARALISDEKLDDALELLSDIDRDHLTSEDRGLVGLTCAAIYHMSGNADRLEVEVDAVAADTTVPSPLRELAVSWRQVLIAARGGSIGDAVQVLRRTAARQSRAKLHYYAGVTYHNAANAELARANYGEARDLAEESMRHLRLSVAGEAITPSTRMLTSVAHAEIGDIEEALRVANSVATEPGAPPDAIAEAALMHAACGRNRRARALLAGFERSSSSSVSDPIAELIVGHARIALHLAEGEHDKAERCLGRLRVLTPIDPDAKSRLAVLEAYVAVVTKSASARQLAQQAVEVASNQNAWRWTARARILDAVARRDGESLALWIGEAESSSYQAILDVADAVAAAVGTLVPLPEPLERSMLREPARWLSALARQLQGPPSDDAVAAASLVARFGGIEDIPILREYERLTGARRQRSGVAGRLIRRVSPTVRIHDLGVSSFEVGDRRVELTETRRKPGALLLFLGTRPGLVAAREQVMDSLWPDQSPKSAQNSLHQTIHYLRRELEPWHEDGVTAGYVRVEGEVVRLDEDLFQIDSVSFARQAADILSTNSALSRGPELLGHYRGRFAPEFEYEEWALEWRTHLHTTYLHLAHATSHSLVGEGRLGEVVEVLSPVATLDPEAFELRATLVGCLALSGATDAAQAQYRSLASAYERDLGLPPPFFEDIIRTIRGGHG